MRERLHQTSCHNESLVYSVHMTLHLPEPQRVDGGDDDDAATTLNVVWAILVAVLCFRHTKLQVISPLHLC